MVRVSNSLMKYVTGGLWVCLLVSVSFAADLGSVGVYEVMELSFTGPESNGSDDPTMSHDFYVEFEHSGGTTYKVYGFWDGDGNGGRSGNVYKVRFCPTAEGQWTLKNVNGPGDLSGQKQGDQITATSSDKHGFWVPDPDNAGGGRWYMRSDGSHQYIVGNTHYDFLFAPKGNEASASTIEKDISDNSDWFKKLRFCLMSPRGENESSQDDGRPFLDGSGNPTGEETDQCNPSFHTARVDVAVKKGFEKDFITDLVLGGTAGDQWATEEGYLKYVAARYGSYPNVWITIGQEYNEGGHTQAEQVQVGNTLAQYLPYPTPVSTHPQHHGVWHKDLNGDWHDHVIIQGKSGDMDGQAKHIHEAYELAGGKPVINDETGYDPGEQSTEDVVSGITGTFVGGGYGTTGQKNSSKNGGYFWGHAAVGEDISTHPSRTKLKFLRDKIEEHMAFWNLEPREPGNSVFSGGAYTLQWENSQYVVGTTGSGNMTADLPTGTYTVIQLDIQNEQEQTISTDASGNYSFDAPSSSAAVILFTNNELGDITAIEPSAPRSVQVPRYVTVGLETTGAISISTSRDGRVVIVDSRGRIKLSRQVQANERIQVGDSSLPRGMYSVQFSDRNGRREVRRVNTVTGR